MLVKSKSEIIDVLDRHQNEIRQFKVRKLGLFGSFVRDEPKEDSDVDLLVEYEKGYKTIDNFLGLIDFLEEKFDRTVELVTAESLSKYIRPKIENEIEYVDFV